MFVVISFKKTLVPNSLLVNQILEAKNNQKATFTSKNRCVQNWEVISLRVASCAACRKEP